MHKVFISYHHRYDQGYKECLVDLGEQNGIFADGSVDTGDIPDHLSDQQIRERIRDECLEDSTVTIVLVGTETKRRKHVDWEIYSSMYDGKINKKSGVIAIELPTAGRGWIVAPHGRAEKALYPDNEPWKPLGSRAECERRHPFMPERLVDNLPNPEARISVVPWCRVNAGTLGYLVEAAHRDRASCVYDLSRPMRRANS